MLRWDYNPLFYYVETLSRNAFGVTFPHARQFAETMLHLHTMDTPYFFKSGDIRPDPQKVAPYLGEGSPTTLAELAEQHVRQVSEELFPHVPVLLLQSIYACLLKMGILNSAKQSQQRKMEGFFSFLHNDLGALFLREALIAGLHFRGKAFNLAPINPRTKIDLKTRLLASTWDVMLLRMPEFLLVEGDQDDTTIAYVCSADRAIQEVGAMFTVLRNLQVQGRRLWNRSRKCSFIKI